MMNTHKLLDDFHLKHVLNSSTFQLPTIRTGYTVGVQTKADASSGKVRGQYFEGVVISVAKAKGVESFMVRKFYKKDYVTRKFCAVSDDIESVVVIKNKHFRKAKLYRCTYKQKI